jgi:hypothetical protein
VATTAPLKHCSMTAVRLAKVAGAADDGADLQIGDERSDLAKRLPARLESGILHEYDGSGLRPRSRPARTDRMVDQAAQASIGLPKKIGHKKSLRQR